MTQALLARTLPSLFHSHLPLTPRALSASDGANATILGRREANIRDAAAKLTKDTGKECLGVAGDVRKPESLKAAVEATIKKFGRIDFVSGCAWLWWRMS